MSWDLLAQETFADSSVPPLSGNDAGIPAANDRVILLEIPYRRGDATDLALT